MRNVSDYMAQCQARCRSFLNDPFGTHTPLEQVEPAPYNQRLQAACRYALVAGGKQVRPILMYAAFDACVGRKFNEGLDVAGAAIEMIHTYSLVHDDLPAMDDDDLRRGQPSCHKAFDVATAILAGDGLQARAFELLAVAPGFSDKQRVSMVSTLAKAAGVHGMVGGQAIDIASVDQDLTLPQLQAMHALKTGSLIRAAVALGGIAANATEDQLAALDKYAKHIGLAFQIVDDIIDVEGTTESLGKTQGKDEAANKATYVKLLGLDGAKDEAQRMLEHSISALDGFDDKADHLRSLARYIVEREY